MKHLIYITVILFAITELSAQEITLKDGVIFSNNKPTFTFVKKSMNNEFYVYKLNTKEELFHMIVDNNGTEIKQDDGKKIFFDLYKVTVQSKNFRARKWDFLIALIVEEKVIDLKGDINLDNLNRFKAKYDDNDINKTMR